MPTRTLGVALWNYRDHDGRKRRAHYRETIDLPEAEVTRGERAGVFAPIEGITQKATPSDATPAKTSTKPALIGWLVEHRGADPGAIEGLTKPKLWQLVEESEEVALQQDSE